MLEKLAASDSQKLGDTMSILSLRRVLARLVASLLLGLAGSSAAQAQTDSELAAWVRANSVNTADAYQEYLSEFPLGKHSQDAFAQMIRLTQFKPAPNEPISQEVRKHEPDPPEGPY